MKLWARVRCLVFLTRGVVHQSRETRRPRWADGGVSQDVKSHRVTAEVGDATTSSQYSASRQSVACLGIASPPYIDLHRRRPYIYSCIRVFIHRQQTQWSCVRTLGHLRRTAEKTNEWVLHKAGLKRKLLDTVKASKLALWFGYGIPSDSLPLYFFSLQYYCFFIVVK